MMIKETANSVDGRLSLDNFCRLVTCAGSSLVLTENGREFPLQGPKSAFDAGKFFGRHVVVSGVDASRRQSASLFSERNSSPAGAAAMAWCRAKQECGPGRGATSGSLALCIMRRFATSVSNLNAV